MILNEIRKQINARRLSRYEISKQTGVDQATLCRVMQGGSCKVETAEKLLDFFGYTLREPQKQKYGR